MSETLPQPPANYNEDRAQSWRAGVQAQLVLGGSHPQQGCSPEFYDGWMAMAERRKQLKVGDEVDIVNRWGRVELTGWRITGETPAFWLVSLTSSTSRYRKKDLALFPQYSPEPRFLRLRVTGTAGAKE